MQAIAQLMQVKKIESITVREITEAADINRTTFYLHYKDINQLVEQIEAELYKEFSLVLENHPIEMVKGAPYTVFVSFYHCFDRNADLFKAFLSENSDGILIKRMNELIKTRVMSVWMGMPGLANAQSFDTFFSYLESGFNGLIRHWLENGKKESAEQMAALSEKMALSCMNMFRQTN